jgi:hypothetical protein
VSIAINPYFAPTPVTGAQLLLNLRNGGKVVTHIDDTSQHFWTLRVRSAPPGALSNGVVANVNYSDGVSLFNGACKVQSLGQGGRRLVIKTPTWFKSRPMRKFQRFNLSLPTSLVLPQDDFCHFVPRTEARILNISEGGVLLGLREPLAYHGKRILLLADTSQVMGNAGSNVYFATKRVRQEQQKSPDKNYPYTYGLAFGNLPPLYKQLLDLLLDQVGEGQQSSTSAVF